MRSVYHAGQYSAATCSPTFADTKHRTCPLPLTDIFVSERWRSAPRKRTPPPVQMFWTSGQVRTMLLRLPIAADRRQCTCGRCRSSMGWANAATI